MTKFRATSYRNAGGFAVTVLALALAAPPTRAQTPLTLTELTPTKTDAVDAAADTAGAVDVANTTDLTDVDLTDADLTDADLTGAADTADVTDAADPANGTETANTANTTDTASTADPLSGPIRFDADALASPADTSQADSTSEADAVSQAPPDAPSEPFDVDTSDVSPGRTTRSGPSYVGVGANIGIGDGDTALGETSFSIFSKIGLTSNISVRPSVLVEDDPTILLPLTLDFVPGVTEVTEEVTEDIGVRVSPYIGAGVAISIGDDTAADFLATGGVDIPIAEQVTANISVSASLFDNPAVGVLLGVGYNLPF